MDNCIEVFEILKRGKKREIVTYSKNSYGRDLRNKHEKINLFHLSKFPSSKVSFAYKNGVSTKDALKYHCSSNLYIKLDIKNFFNSISYENFLSKVSLKNSLKTLIFDCFYKDSLPIGFVNSPKLSDIYLYDFDVLIEKYLESHNTLHYSRYCDDILISSEENNFGSLHTFFSYIKKNLEEYGLSINQEKVREFDLSKDTSVQFLGLNLSKKDGNYRITLSKTFILETLDVISEAYDLKNKMNKNYTILEEANYWNKYKAGELKNEDSCKLNDLCNEYYEYKIKLSWISNTLKSRVAYIKYNSEVSYNRFLKKHENKFGFKWGTLWL